MSIITSVTSVFVPVHREGYRFVGIFAAVTLGGLGTAFGALIGSLVVGVLVETSSLFIPADLKYVGALVVLIGILLFRPQGLLGKKQRIG